MSGRFPLKYAGTPSQFEGRAYAPSTPGKAVLRVTAFDAAGNAGAHTSLLTVEP